MWQTAGGESWLWAVCLIQDAHQVSFGRMLQGIPRPGRVCMHLQQCGLRAGRQEPRGPLSSKPRHAGHAIPCTLWHPQPGLQRFWWGQCLWRHAPEPQHGGPCPGHGSGVWRGQWVVWGCPRWWVRWPRGWPSLDPWPASGHLQRPL